MANMVNNPAGEDAGSDVVGNRQVGWLLPDGSLVSLGQDWPEPWNETWEPIYSDRLRKGS